MQTLATSKSGTIPYSLRRNARSRRMRLTVHRDGSVVVTVPVWLSQHSVRTFMMRHAEWLMRKVAAFRALPPAHPAALYGRREYLLRREEARAFVLARAEMLASVLGVTFGRVSIRNQRTCWGSCSRQGNLNFNYKILFLPVRLQDYVIVHELAHRSEMNHSPRFWAVVARVCPDWRALRRELRGMRML